MACIVLRCADNGQSGYHAIFRIADAGETVCAMLEDALYMEHVWAEIRRPLRDAALPTRGEVRAFPLRKR